MTRALVCVVALVGCANPPAAVQGDPLALSDTALVFDFGADRESS